MIAKLTGIVDSIGDDWVVIDVGGVGYLVQCSRRTLGRLAAGEAVSLLIETHVREDQITLFGFSAPGERQWFRLLTSVQGVGARMALAILSVLAPDELVQAIAAGDRTALTRANGVGPKVATRVLSVLRDKVGGIVLGSPGAPASAPSAAAAGGATGEAVSALVHLGYSASEALGAVSQAAQRLGPEAGIEALIRGGLSELAPKEFSR